MSKKNYEEITDTYCYFAMHSFSIHAHGKARTCCVSRDNTSNTFIEGKQINKISVDQIYPNKKFKSVDNLESYINDSALMNTRAAMLKGEKPDACSRCWNLEKHGIKSFREIQNDTYKNNIDKTISHVRSDGKLDISGIRYLDITLGNICNLKCRSCNPWNSHRWIEEGPSLPHVGWRETDYQTGKLSNENPWFVNAFNTGFFDSVLPNVDAINFLGGEPLVVIEHYSWLEYIIEKGWSKNIKLFYNTNGTTFPDRLFDIWKNFKEIHIGLSIDAIGELAYYVRHPSKWHVIEKNIKKLADHSAKEKNIFVQTHVTLSCLNLHDIPNILDWCKKNFDEWHYQTNNGRLYSWNFGYQNRLPHFNIVEYPEYLNIKHLPEELKIELSSMLDEQYTRTLAWGLKPWEVTFAENLLGVKSTLNQPRVEPEWKKFIQITEASDKFRNLNINDYIGWASKYFKK